MLFSKYKTCYQAFFLYKDDLAAKIVVTKIKAVFPNFINNLSAGKSHGLRLYCKDSWKLSAGLPVEIEHTRMLFSGMFCK